MEPNGPKVLFLDIETSYNEVYTFSVGRTYITPDKIQTPTQMISWAAMWEHGDEIYSSNLHHATQDEMIEGIYELVDEADICVHYNGSGFDMKHLNREFLLAGYHPPTKYRNLDLYQVIRRQFNLPSYKLDYVLWYFGLSRKVQHEGFDLWVRCIKHNDPEAWAKMEEYNIGDVEVLQELYDTIQGWIPNHPNRALWMDNVLEPTCRNCGSTHLHRKGKEFPANAFAYERFKCMDCGANNRGRLNIGKIGEGGLL